MYNPESLQHLIIRIFERHVHGHHRYPLPIFEASCIYVNSAANIYYNFSSGSIISWQRNNNPVDKRKLNLINMNNDFKTRLKQKISYIYIHIFIPLRQNFVVFLLKRIPSTKIFWTMKSHCMPHVNLFLGLFITKFAAS